MEKIKKISILLLIVQLVLCVTMALPVMAAENQAEDTVIQYSLKVDGGLTAEDGTTTFVAGSTIKVTVSIDSNPGFLSSKFAVSYPENVTYLAEKSNAATLDETQFSNITLGAANPGNIAVITGDPLTAAMGTAPVQDGTGIDAVLYFQINDGFEGDLTFDRYPLTGSTVLPRSLSTACDAVTVSVADEGTCEGFVQSNKSTNDVRVLVKAPEDFLAKFKDAVLTVTFTGENATDVKPLTVTADKAYTSVKAAGAVVEAGEGNGFIGVVIKSVPKGVTVSATATFRSASGDVVVELGSAAIA